MTIDFAVQAFLYVLLIIFILLFTIVACKWQDEVHRNYELQNENSDLIERNEKLDTYLDETRAVVITQNDIIRDVSELTDEKYFGRTKVLNIIEELLERPDVLMDAIQNENTDYSAEDLLEIALGKQ